MLFVFKVVCTIVCAQKTKAEVEQLTNSRREMELQLETVVQRTRLEINEYVQRTTILENELHITRTYIEERRATDEKTAELALELEKERGRLAGTSVPLLHFNIFFC